MVFATAVDKRAPRSVYGIAIGGVVGMSVFGIGGISGAALNSTRWLGPWIVGLWANVDDQAKLHSHWAAFPYLVFTNLGGIVAGITYKSLFLSEKH